MDIYLVKGFNSQHAVSSLNEYSSYINRTLYSIYTKGEELHSTIHAGHPKGLTLKEILKLIQYLDTTVDDLAAQCGLQLGERDIEVKLNFHSPGLIELIGYAAAAGTSIALIMFALNNLINGGKFKVSFKREITGEMDFSIESETKGIKGNERKDKEIKIKEAEVLINMVKELDIKSPEIMSSLINGEKITAAMVSAAIESNKENITSNTVIDSNDETE